MVETQDPEVDTPGNEAIMKCEGCSILFVNVQNEVLLALRDDIPSIPYPNMWDVLGGHIEEGETPEQCITREMKEELDLDIGKFQLFLITEFPDRTEYTFWRRADFDIAHIILTEGQCLKWFTEHEIKNTELAYGFNQVVQKFFTEAPFM